MGKWIGYAVSAVVIGGAAMAAAAFLVPAIKKVVPGAKA